jgi:hypothetical protein
MSKQPQAAQPSQRQVQSTPAPTTRATGPAAKANDNPKMVAAGHKAAAKAKHTERASFALVYAFEFGGGKAGLEKAYAGIQKEEWAALAVARALKIAQEAKKPEELVKLLTALLATLKPRAGVGPSVPADPTRAVVKISKKGTRYAIIRFPDSCTLGEGAELAVTHKGDATSADFSAKLVTK